MAEYIMQKRRAYARMTPSMTGVRATSFAEVTVVPRMREERNVVNIGVAARTT